MTEITDELKKYIEELKERAVIDATEQIKNIIKRVDDELSSTEHQIREKIDEMVKAMTTNLPTDIGLLKIIASGGAVHASIETFKYGHQHIRLTIDGDEIKSFQMIGAGKHRIILIIEKLPEQDNSKTLGEKPW